MTMPPLVPNRANDQVAWIRVAADAINTLLRRLLQVGTTAQRPANPTDGQMFYDRTLKKPVFWNTEDAEWKDAAGIGV